jgi:hypothetical protein
MKKEYIKKIISRLKLLLKLDDLEIIKCVIESLIEELEDMEK